MISEQIDDRLTALSIDVGSRTANMRDFVMQMVSIPGVMVYEVRIASKR